MPATATSYVFAQRGACNSNREPASDGDRQLSFREIDDYVAEVMQSEMMRQAMPGNFGASMASEAKTEL